MLIAACIVHGEVDQLQGRSHTAREWIERGLALLETLDAAPGKHSLPIRKSLCSDCSRCNCFHSA